MWCETLSKNGTGKKDTNGKVGKNGSLMLNFLKTQTPTQNPNL